MSTDPEPRFTTKPDPGINLAYRELVDSFEHDLEKALRMEGQLRTGNNKWSVHQRLVKYAELCRAMVKLLIAQNEFMNGLTAEYKQLTGGTGERAHKRWTPHEDEILVDMVCQEDSTLIELALAFNRTPQAITSRLTYLVGVSKVNRQVAGRLIGYLDGEPVDGYFEGRLGR